MVGFQTAISLDQDMKEHPQPVITEWYNTCTWLYVNSCTCTYSILHSNAILVGHTQNWAKHIYIYTRAGMDMWLSGQLSIDIELYTCTLYM